MPADFELSGPSFIGFMVRDLEVAAEFYEKTLGLRRDPEGFKAPGKAVTFLTYPLPIALLAPPPGMDADKLPKPVRQPAIWFKTANTRIVYDSLVAAGVTILRPPSEGRFGTTFTFADPDGYALTIYDRDMPAGGWEA
ncbi:MAG TPA: VOC family protein [Phototrophicaceae bacterium]|nr:VOC family protein [Phototrophicaceae bacterium]